MKIFRQLPVICLVILGLTLFSCSENREIVEYQEIGRMPNLNPDFTNLIIPANIAPLNFQVNEVGDRFFVRMTGRSDPAVLIHQDSPEIRIPEDDWKKILQENVGDSVHCEVFVFNKEQWSKFEQFSYFVSPDSIDPYVYYRDIVPTNSLWNKMAMHQRNLQNFKEEEVFNNYRIEHNCMNCHTFNHNNPDQMLFHVRGKHGGTVFYNHGELKKVNLKTPETLSAGAYCSWHPNGKLVAFAVNKIKQNYYLSGHDRKMKEVFDLASDIVIYNVDNNKLFSFPEISSGMRENLPCWSADGKYLYFTSAKEYEKDMDNEKSLYSLMRISYNEQTNTVGEPDELISAEEIGKSIAFPTVSPNGKYLFFAMVDFGYFPVNNKTADLYLMDLETMQYKKPDINSDESESYISWSGNSRWFVFSSRKMDGMTSKPYFSHIDSMGNVSKPFILPQEDPRYYSLDLRNFARPELISKRFSLDFGDLEGVIYGDAEQAEFKNLITSEN